MLVEGCFAGRWYSVLARYNVVVGIRVRSYGKGASCLVVVETSEKVDTLSVPEIKKTEWLEDVGGELEAARRRVGQGRWKEGLGDEPPFVLSFSPCGIQKPATQQRALP